MTSRTRVLAFLTAAVALAGCGAASPPAHRDRPAPRIGPLRVSPTDVGLGDAALASPAGRLRVHPLNGRAPQRAGLGAGAGCADADLMPAAAVMPRVATATLCLLNDQRAAAGLPALTANRRLAAAALGHASDMVAHQYFAHDSLDGRTFIDRLDAAGYIPADQRWLVGENLAWGTGTLATPAAIVAAWMHSPEHRANIVRPQFREIGLGIARGNPAARDGAGATYATEFGLIGDPGTPTTAVAATGTPAPAHPAVRRHRTHHRRHHHRRHRHHHHRAHRKHRA